MTWHWEGPDCITAHARPTDDTKALCGRAIAMPPLMRPPLVEARCETCFARTEKAVSIYPNLYAPTGI